MKQSSASSGGLSKTAAFVLAAFVGVCLCTGTAQAASPAWKLLAATGPTNLPPRQSEVQRLTIEADGGTFAVSLETAKGEATTKTALALFSVTNGSDEATHVTGATPEVGQAALAFGTPAFPPGTTVTAVEGTTVTFSHAAERSGVAYVNLASKEVTAVSTSEGAFRVGDGISGKGIPAGTTVTAVGPNTLMLSQAPTSGGTVELTGTEQTGSLPYDASATSLQGSFEALPAFSTGLLTVSGGPGGNAEHPYFLDFGGPLAEKNVEELGVDGTGLQGQHAAAHVFTTLPGGPGTGEIAIDPANIGAAAIFGEYTVEVGPLPAGIVTAGPGQGEGWNCSGGAGESTVTCSSSVLVRPLTPANNIRVPVEVEPAVAISSSAPIMISGGGGGAASYQMPIVVSRQEARPGAAAFWAGAYNADGEVEAQAGSHPFSALSYFLLNTVRSTSGKINPVGDSKDVVVDLPPGFAGDPMVTARCPQSQVVPPGYAGSPACNEEEMKVGVFDPNLLNFGAAATSFASQFYNNVPPRGYAAEFTTKIAYPTQSLLASTRDSEDYGIRITAPNNPSFDKIFGAYAALEGFPAAAHGKPFLRNPTECSGVSPVVGTKSDTYQEPGNFSVTATQVLPAVTGCDKLHFHPSFTFQPSSAQGSSPVGATAHLHLPQEGLTDSEQLAPPDLKRAEVRLPAGLVLNPSSANGLEACTESQIGLITTSGDLPNPIRFSESAPGCPDGSKLGTVEVESPLLEEALKGTVYLASPEDNPFHSLIAIYLVIDDARTGIVLKLPGEVKLDPSTGQLTATFDNNPQLPFEDMTLQFRGGGPRSEFATPEVCGHYATTGALTPWSAPESGPPAQIDEAGFTVGTGCAASASTRPFQPGFEAGTTGTNAGGYNPLVIKLNRKDGEQELSSLDFTLPKGLLGKLAGIPYCPDVAIVAAEHKTGKAELAASSCPAASQIGTVDTGAGVGSQPFHVGGKLYLAGPYKGAPVSSVVITPAVAGPFDLGNVVVRAPLYVDPETAQLSAKSDPIPTILKGIQLKVRSVVINVDRGAFILNPTNCTPMTASALVGSSNGATAAPSNRFQVGGCENLKFAPKLQVKLKGGTRRNAKPALTAILRQAPGQANIGFASVALPHSEFLEQGHIKTICTRVQFAAQQCPQGSIYGRAEAVTPLLDQPLRGPVYLRSSSHRLPDMVAALRGPAWQPIEIDLDGRIDSIHGGIRTTFEAVPDAPVSKFVLRMRGGRKSLIVNSTNICRGKHKATVRMTGQNGRRHNFSTALKAQCGKKAQKHHKKSKKHSAGKKRGTK